MNMLKIQFSLGAMLLFAAILLGQFFWVDLFGTQHLIAVFMPTWLCLAYFLLIAIRNIILGMING